MAFIWFAQTDGKDQVLRQFIQRLLQQFAHRHEQICTLREIDQSLHYFHTLPHLEGLSGFTPFFQLNEVVLIRHTRLQFGKGIEFVPFGAVVVNRVLQKLELQLRAVPHLAQERLKREALTTLTSAPLEELDEGLELLLVHAFKNKLSGQRRILESRKSFKDKLPVDGWRGFSQSSSKYINVPRDGLLSLVHFFLRVVWLVLKRVEVGLHQFLICILLALRVGAQLKQSDQHLRFIEVFKF